MKRLVLSLAVGLFIGTCFAQSYTIYPVPQQLEQGTETVSFTSDVDVLCDTGIDDVTRNRLRSLLSEHQLSAHFTDAPTAGRSTIYLGINGSGDKGDLLASQRSLKRDVFSQASKYDRHLLCLSQQNQQAELLVLGENTDAVFFGLASLEQMLDRGTSQLPTVEIYDYADQQSRGLVEGYYGYPYSVSVKKDLLRFMMRYKMNTYLYGAKSDPYHSEKWKAAYPTSITAEQETNGWLSQNMIAEIARESQQTKVNFIWAIHPGGNFINSTTVVDDIIGKFQLMYKLGVRQFGIFVDDVGLPSSDKYELNATRLTQVQQRLEALYNTPGAAPADTIKPLHFVPQAYAAGFVNDTQREGFFKALGATPACITIYTTGWGVWSIPNSNDLYATAKHLGRDVAWWWNYPCNDNADGQIYTMDMYSNFYDLPAVDNNGSLPKTLTHGVGIVSNPMQEGELSKIALFSVADYAWNTDGFSVKSSWKAAVRAVVGDEAYEDYIFLADYLRYNDPSGFNSLLTAVKNRLHSSSFDASALEERLQKIAKACDTFIAFKDSQRECDRLFYQDIKPWLLKLKQMTVACTELLAVAKLENTDDRKWERYLAALGQLEELSTNEDYIAYALEGMGSGISVSQRTSQPSHLYFNKFLTYLKEHLLEKYFGTTADKLTVITNATATNPFKAKTTDGSFTLSGSGSLTLQPGEFVGLSLPDAQLLDALFVAEELREATVRCSANGKDWTTYLPGEAAPTDYVKYIVFLNQTAGPLALRPVFSNFHATPVSAPVIESVTVPSGGDASGTQKSNLTDGDYTTWYSVNRNQANNDAYVLNLKDTTVVRDVRVCVGTTNGDYMNAARVEVSLDGRTWTMLKVKGSVITNFTMKLSQVVTYSDEMKYCDFDGNNRKALYVRFRVTNANTSRWLRLFEIEVNKHSGTMSRVVDAKGASHSELTDQQAYTACSADGNALYYNFLQIHPLRSVTIYHDPAAASDAVVAVSTDNAEWTELGPLDAAVSRFDLSAYPEARQLRISWQQTAPKIYELLEQTDESQELITTNITPVLETLLQLDPSAIRSLELYDLQGRCIYRQRCLSAAAPALSAAAPAHPSAPTILIAKYTLRDGQQLVRRFLYR